MKDKNVSPLLDEHFITRNEIKELTLSIEKLQQGIDDIKRSNHSFGEDVGVIRHELLSDLVNSLTFRMVMVASIFGFTQLIFKVW